MNKFIIVAAALPLVSISGGYAAGMILSAEPEKTEVAAPDPVKQAQEQAKALIASAEETAPSSAASAPPNKVDHKAPTQSQGTTGQAHSTPAAQAKTDMTAAADHAAPTGPAKRSADVVKLGQMTIPVHKPKSITYVVVDLGIAMPDAETAAHYRVAENAVHLRDTIIASFGRAVENPKMKRASLDSDWLSETLTEDLKREVKEVQEVLFLTLYKKDVPRS